MKQGFVPVRIARFAALLTASVLSGQAGTVTWTNATGGNWSAASNWSPNRVPGHGDTAVIPGLASSYAVTLDVAATVSGLVVGAAGGLRTQTFNIIGPTLTVNGLIHINSCGAFNLNGGTLTGTNVLAGALNWIAGNLESVTTVGNNAVLNIASGGGAVAFYGATLTNHGTVNWTNTSINSDGGTRIYNYSLWNEQSDDYFSGASEGGAGTVFNNFGTLRKSGNTGTTTLDGGLILNNTGTVDVENGTLELNGGGTNSGAGAFNSGGPATIYFFNGYNFFSGSSFSGAGSVVLITGTFTLNGVIKSANLQVLGGGVALTGTNVLTGTLTWNAGYLEGAMTVSDNSVLNIASRGGGGAVAFYGATLTNHGTVNWISTSIYSGQGTRIYNYGLWNEQSDDYFYGANEGGPGTVFNNFGTLRKSGNTGTTTLDGSLILNNTGTVDAESGTLAVNGGGASSGAGAFNSGSPAMIDFFNGYNFLNGASFSGAGVVALATGTFTVKGVIKTANLQLAGGTLAGTNVLAGTLNWSAGNVEGVTTISNNGVLNIASGGGAVVFYGATLTNRGTVNWTNTSINSDGGTRICNYGLWNEQSDDNFFGASEGGPGTVFNNFGTLRKSGTTGTTTLDGNVALNNTGTLDTQSGTVSLGSYNLTGGTLNFGISSLTRFGAINLAGNAGLTGTISANWNNNYIPMVNDAFPVINYNSFSGRFTKTNLPSLAVWQTAYNPANVTIQVLMLKFVPPAITIQPAGQNPPLGGSAAFSVKATGAPLFYQWLFNGIPLSDSGNISGAGTNRLTVNLVGTNDVGGYSVVVSDSATAVTSRVVRLALGVELTKPSVAIASPRAGSRTNAPVLRGTASDSVRVLKVKYWVTNVNDGVITILKGQAALAAGTGAVSNWTVQAALLPGTNILAVRSYNYAGRKSPVADAPFFYQVTTPFQLLASPAGAGTVTGVASVRGDAPPADGAALYIGEGYTLTANPATNWRLTNWLENGSENNSIAGTNSKLTFIMEPSLVLTANFATNLFIGASARYDGIFYLSDAQGATEATSGLIENLQLKTNGVYSGKLYLAGSSYPLMGGFNASGQATETIARTPLAGGGVTLQLTIPWQSVPRQITGSVQGANLGGWISSNLFLCAATTNTNNFPAYTVLLAQDPNLSGGTPPGYGYALITNTGSMINLGGFLSDGTPFSRSEPVNEEDQFPVYASLYNNTGLLLGRMSLSAGTFGAVPAGSVAWIKPPQRTGLYTNGFNTGLGVAGSPWTNSAPALAGLFPNNAQLTFSGGGLASNLVCTVQLTSSNTFRLVSGSTNFTSGSINRTNGQLTVNFRNTSGQKAAASGAVLQNTNLGGGFFLGATNAGAITVTP